LQLKAWSFIFLARFARSTSEIEAGVLYFNSPGNRPITVSSAHWSQILLWKPRSTSTLDAWVKTGSGISTSG